MDFGNPWLWLAWAVVIAALLGGIGWILRCWRLGDHRVMLEDRLDRAEERFDRAAVQMGEQTTIISQLMYMVSQYLIFPEQPAPTEEPRELLGAEIANRLVEIITKPGTRRSNEDFDFAATHWNLSWCEHLVTDGLLTVPQIEAFARGTRSKPTPEIVAEAVRITLEQLSHLSVPDDLSGELTVTSSMRAIKS